jgi:preprotein translocase subunit Sec63
MSSHVSNFLWKHVFTAFLPPLNPDDVDYYTVLGLSTNNHSVTSDDIRKAYRKLSLELHPDKIAQRGGGKVEQESARERYERVQQAYGMCWLFRVHAWSCCMRIPSLTASHLTY